MKDLIERLHKVSTEIANAFGDLKDAELHGGLTEEEISIIIVSFGRCLTDIKTMLAMREATRAGRRGPISKGRKDGPTKLG
jgi:hypothetical protein